MKSQKLKIPPEARLASGGKSQRYNENGGITLLLVVVILSALMSISLGVFNLIFGEILIAGEMSDSFFALYASDQGIEKTLYRDRIAKVVCKNPAGDPDGTNVIAEDCDPPTTTDVESKACYTTRVDKTADGIGGINITVDSSGEFRCGGNPARVVRRRFQVTYLIQTQCNDGLDNESPPDSFIDFLPGPGGDPQCLDINDDDENL